MAVLTLTPRTPYTIKYEIGQMTEQFVYTAKVEIFRIGSSTPFQVATYKSIDVEEVTSICGYFGGLQPSTTYRVHENIFDEDGNITSSQEGTATTNDPFYETPNSVIHSIDLLTKTEVYNTFETWGLVPATRPSIAPPELKSKYVDLPASDGILDYTELLLGKVPFGRRTGSWTFYTDHRKMKHQGYTWDHLYYSLLRWINGVEVEITLDDDLDFYYKGRVSVNQWRSGKAFSTVVIDYTCDSYKYSRTRSSDVDWQWDDAIEDQDYTILYGDYSAQEYKVMNFINPGGQVTIPFYNVDTTASSGLVTIKTDFGDLVAEVILGKWGLGQDRRDRLTAAGLCWQMVQNAVNEALGSNSRVVVPYDDPDPAVQARIAATQALKDQGKLDTGEEHTLINGQNYNSDLGLEPGDNLAVIFTEPGSQTNITTDYPETSA